MGSLWQNIKFYIARARAQLKINVHAQVLKLTPVHFRRVVSCPLVSRPRHSSCVFYTASGGVKRTCWTTGSWRCYYSDVIMGAMASRITSLIIVYSTVYSEADQRKHQSSASVAFVQGIHLWPVNSPHKWPVTRKMFRLFHPHLFRDNLSVPLKVMCISLPEHQNKTDMYMYIYTLDSVPRGVIHHKQK